MHHVSSFTQLLQILLQSQFGIRQLMLGRWWCAVLVRVLAWSSAHLRVGIRVASHVEARRVESDNQMLRVQVLLEAATEIEYAIARRAG